MSSPAKNRVRFAKNDPHMGAMSTYTVMLDGTKIGAISKVRDRYLRRLGGHRGNNVPAARDAWTIENPGSRINYDSRAEAAVALIADTQGIDHGDALDIVQGKA